MDVMCKGWERVIKGDPNNITNNGKIMMGIIEWKNLKIANSLAFCKGTITRERLFAKKADKSVIDFIVICEELAKYIIEMSIDEEIMHVLSSFVKTRASNKIIKSDHTISQSFDGHSKRRDQ